MIVCIERGGGEGAAVKIHGCTVEPPNKAHVGDNINSAVLSFIERLSSFRGSKCT